MTKRKRTAPKKYKRFSTTELIGAFSEDQARALIMLDNYLEINYKAIYGLEFMLEVAPKKISPEAKQFFINYIKTKILPDHTSLIEKMEEAPK